MGLAGLIVANWRGGRTSKGRVTNLLAIVSSTKLSLNPHSWERVVSFRVFIIAFLYSWRHYYYF